MVSDSTGITAETLASALLASFPDLQLDRHTVPFVDSEAAARAVVSEIDQASALGLRPLVFTTVKSAALRRILRESDAVVIDLLEGPLHELEAALATTASEQPAPQHSVTTSRSHSGRIRAVQYAIEHDDGQGSRALDVAELIIVAPSRCGKTETALYLAVQFGLLVANVPLTSESRKDADGLPAEVRPHLRRCFGLTSTPQRLHQVRSERWPYSTYANLRQCTLELRRAEDVYRRHGIPFLNSATTSVEETSASIIRTMNLRTEIF